MAFKFTDGSKRYIRHSAGKTVLEISDGIDTVFFPLKSFCNFLALHKDDVARFVSVVDEPEDDDEEEVARRVSDSWDVINNLPGESLQLTELRQRLAILTTQRHNLFDAVEQSIRAGEAPSASPFWSQYLDARESEEAVQRDIMELTTPPQQPNRSIIPPHAVPLSPLIPETAAQRQTRQARATFDAISRVGPRYIQNASGEVVIEQPQRQIPPLPDTQLQRDINAMYQSRAEALATDVWRAIDANGVTTAEASDSTIQSCREARAAADAMRNLSDNAVAIDELTRRAAVRAAENTVRHFSREAIPDSPF